MAEERTQEHLDTEDMAVVSDERRSVRTIPRTPLDELRDAVISARLANYSVSEITQVVFETCEVKPDFVYQGKPHFNVKG